MRVQTSEKNTNSDTQALFTAMDAEITHQHPSITLSETVTLKKTLVIVYNFTNSSAVQSSERDPVIVEEEARQNRHLKTR